MSGEGMIGVAVKGLTVGAAAFALGACGAQYGEAFSSGGQSQTADASPTASSAALAVDVLKLGSKGEAVTSLQASLGSIGCGIRVTSTYDGQTVNAVVKFENNLGLDPAKTFKPGGVTALALGQTVKAHGSNCGVPKSKPKVSAASKVSTSSKAVMATNPHEAALRLKNKGH